MYHNEVSYFSKVSSNQVKQSKFKIAKKVFRKKSSVAKTFYGLSKIKTFFKRIERLF